MYKYYYIAFYLFPFEIMGNRVAIESHRLNFIDRLIKYGRNSFIDSSLIRRISRLNRDQCFTDILLFHKY